MYGLCAVHTRMSRLCDLSTVCYFLGKRGTPDERDEEAKGPVPHTLRVYTLFPVSSRVYMRCMVSASLERFYRMVVVAFYRSFTAVNPPTRAPEVLKPRPRSLVDHKSDKIR